MIGILASVIDGILIGAVYGLAAMGLTLIWGVMNVINLAHGAIVVIGMFVLYMLASMLGLPAYGAVPVMIVFGFVVGIGLYWIGVHRMIGRAELMSLLSTFALNMVLIGLGTAWWTTSPYNVQVSMPRCELAGLHLHRHAHHGSGAGGSDRRASCICCSTTHASARRYARSPPIARPPNCAASRRRRCLPWLSGSASRSQGFPAR